MPDPEGPDPERIHLIPPTSTTVLGEFGEFALISAVTAGLPAHPAVLLGPGDDAAVVAAPDGRVVVTTDLLVENVHFRRDWSPALDVGHKAAAQNLADIAAMGAVPTALVVGFAAPSDLPVQWALDLTAGIRAECEAAGAALAGGDVTRTAGAVTVAVTALGDLQGRDAVTRAGARAGEVVALAGRLGWSAAGFAVLSRGFRSPRVLVEAHRRPQPPYAAGPAAALAGAGAMCDVSDGLVQDLGHVARASGVRIELDRAALTVPDPMRAAAAAIGVDPVTWLLDGGEDHALVATFEPGAVPDGWSVIGRVVTAAPEGPDVVVDGAAWGGAGHDHFGGRS